MKSPAHSRAFFSTFNVARISMHARVLQSTQGTARTHSTRPSRSLFTTAPLYQFASHRIQHRAVRRLLSTSSETVAPRTGRRPGRLTLLGLALGLGLGGSIYLHQTPVRLDSSPASAAQALVSEPRGEKAQPPLITLVRSYLVYSLCSIPALVDSSPTLLKYSFAFPGVRWLAEKVVRGTFFAQFVGGDTAEEAIPIVAALRKEGKGTLFAYSVEVDEDEASGSSSSSSPSPGAEENLDSNGNGNGTDKLPIHKRIVEEMVHAIDVAADFEDGIGSSSANSANAGRMGRRTWVAVKITALVPDAHALRRLSAYIMKTRAPLTQGKGVPFPGAPRNGDLDVLDADGGVVVVEKEEDAVLRLTKKDLRELKELRDDLFRICQRAEERGVRVIIDAEYSWYQPAIDAYTLALMRKFNRPPTSPPSPSSTSSSAPSAAMAFNLKRFVGSKTTGGQKASEDEGGRVQPLVYATYQAYLRRTPAQLAHDLAAARAEGYALGVKLVRGAYHPHEIAAHPASTPAALAEAEAVDVTSTSQVAAVTAPEAGKGKKRKAHTNSLSISPDPVPPVWLVKEESDKCYNECVGVLVRSVAEDLGLPSSSAVTSSRARPKTTSVGVLFGTHNWRSCDVVLEELVRAGLAAKQQQVEREEAEKGRVRAEKVVIPDEVGERVTMGQLYGMSDALTESIVERTRTAVPFVIKYVPYGALVEVMPYLSRRAIENKTILGGRRGGAADERKRAGRAIFERLFGGFGYRAD